MKVSLEFRKDIQALRGIAVLAVIFFHAKSDYFPLGYLGVDIFFVISGFVITPRIMQIFNENSTKIENVIGILNFYRRRIYRLIPAFGFMLILSSIMIFFLGPIGDHKRFGLQGLFSIFLVANIGAFKFSGNYFWPSPNPLVHTWSLSVEEQIYLVLPLIFLIFAIFNFKIERYIRKFILLIFVISLGIYLVPLVNNFVYSSIDAQLIPEINFYSTLSRVWEFLIGSAVFVLSGRKLSTKRYQGPLSSLLTISLIAIIFSPLGLHGEILTLIICMITAYVILEKSFIALPRKIDSALIWTGERSYSIYLWHMPLIYLAKYSKIIEVDKFPNRILQTSFAVALSILIGAFSYRLVEQKFRMTHKSNPAQSKSIVKVILLFMFLPALLFSLILVINQNNYWIWQRNPLPPSFAADLDKNCQRESLYSEPPCEYEIKNSKKSVLLIGDSHAAHFSEAIVESARNAHWNSFVWTHSGCPIIMNNSVKNGIDGRCLKANLGMLKWLKINKPDVVIVSQFVHENFSEKDLREGLLRVKKHVLNLVLIENTPVFPDKEFMVPRPLLMKEYSPPKKFLISEMNKDDIYASKSLGKWARENQIETSNFTALFCNEKYCNRWSNNGWLYKDFGHLSVAGANLSVKYFTDYLLSH